MIALLVGVLYTLPNFFGEAPAVQVSSGKATVKVDAVARGRASSRRARRRPASSPTVVTFDGNSVQGALRRHRHAVQGQGRDLQQALNPDPTDPTYIVALNLLSRSPHWLTALHALPMYLGLDLRGGVHFLLQVDMRRADQEGRLDCAGDVRTLLRDKNMRHAGIDRDGQTASWSRFRDQPTRDAARDAARRPAPRPAVGRRAADGADLQARRRR